MIPFLASAVANICQELKKYFGILMICLSGLLQTIWLFSLFLTHSDDCFLSPTFMIRKPFAHRRQECMLKFLILKINTFCNFLWYAPWICSVLLFTLGMYVHPIPVICPAIYLVNCFWLIDWNVSLGSNCRLVVISQKIVIFGLDLIVFL